jgi:polysaccharide export outer membrane protein
MHRDHWSGLLRKNIMRRRLPSVTAAALLAFSSAPALAATTDMPPPDVSSHNQAGTGYKIEPLDKLEVNVSQVTEMSKPYQVDSGGMILLPLVGQVQAAGRTPSELSDDIAAALKKKYMKDPQVVVSLKEAQGEKITVDGAVMQPGMYDLAGPTTLMQAVSMAKGADPHFANVHKVAIFRQVNGERRSVFYDLAQIRSGHAADPQVYGSDIVVVDTSGSKSFFNNFSGAFGSGMGLLGMLIHPW